MKLRLNSWRKAAGDFRPGDEVIVDRRLEHADMYTPARGSICTVKAVQARPGNLHPIHLSEVGNPRKEDWFNARHIYLLGRKPLAQAEIKHEGM